jgi:ATP-binding cassette subfamily B protein RaxB
MSILDRLDFGGGPRLPIRLQTEAAECGLACMAMIAGYHGYPSELSEMRRRMAVSLKGANLKDLVRMADRIGFAARPVRLELDELSLLKTPCILHWDLNHFVVLKKVGRDSVVIHDPAAGVREVPLGTVSKHFTGVALELASIGGYEPAKALPRVGLRSLLGRVVGLKASLFRLFLLALAIQVFSVIAPLFMQLVVDHALVTADGDLLLTLVLGFTLLMLLRTAVTAMRGWMVIGLGASLKVQGRSNLFSHLAGLPAAYFEARHLGDVMSRFGSQETILQAITTDMIESLLDGLFAMITLAIMFVFAPGLTALVLAGAVSYALLRWMFYTPLRQSSMEAIVWSARRDSHFLETLRGIKTIKLFNGQEGRRAHWLNLLVESVNRQLATQNLRLGFKVVNALVVGVLAIVIVWLGAKQVLLGQMTIGTLLAFIAYKDQFLDRVSNLIDKAVDLVMLRLHAERLADIALTPPEPHEQVFESGKPHAPVGIEVRNLRFRYGENEPWVLDGLNFRIAPGETVAIVGASGCGKTTLFKILASLLAPTQGEFLINGEPLAHIGIARWRSMIGVVMQDDQLFAGSIADNISFFADRPDNARIEHCARQAAVHEDILAMPMGYGTLIGDMGTVLSGGQKQRVLIARALYRQPGLLLLDEATSNLDVGNEKAVSAAIRATNVTRIIVAHRPETIRSAERVIYLDRIECYAVDVTAASGGVQLAAPGSAQLQEPVALSQ